MSRWPNLKAIPFRAKAIPFRVKAVALALTVQALMLGLLVWNSQQVVSELLSKNLNSEIDQAQPLLNAALSAPLVQSDYVTLQEILRDARRERHFDYFLLYDRSGKLIAREGWPEGAGPPVIDHSLATATADMRFDTSMEIRIGPRKIGELRFGVRIDELVDQQRRLLGENLWIAAFTFFASAVLLVGIGSLLTRRLERLRLASEKITSGDFDVTVAEGDDEAGQLGRAFNHMIRVLRERVADLQTSESRFHAIADYTYDVEYWYSPEGKLLWINPSVMRLTGYSVEECLASTDFPWFMIHPDDHERARAERARALGSRGVGSDFEFRIFRKDGQVVWLSNNWQALFSPQGEFLGVRSSFNSIQRLKETELSLRDTLVGLERAVALQNEFAENLQVERSRLLALLSAMEFGVLFVDHDRHVVYRNPAFCGIWSIPEDAPLIGESALTVADYAADVSDVARVLGEKMEMALSGSRSSREVEFGLSDGRILKQLAFRVDTAGSGKPGHLLIYEDVTALRDAEDKLIFLAERDPLTGLYNRRRFEQQLNLFIDQARRDRANVAVLFFDLDEFKSVNDHFGHSMGDAVLTQLAEAVRRTLRRNEFFARLGGDEFALLANNIDESDLQALAVRVIGTIAEMHFSVANQRITLTGSMGVSVYPDHATEAETLMVNADLAMYQAKEAGKNTFCIYTPSLKTSQKHRALISWNDRIRAALKDNRFEVHCQGVFGATDGKLCYNEALIRLPDDETGKLIGPGQFIEHAEKSRLIVDIDYWMIRRCIELLACSRDSVPLAVNISGRTFDDADLAGYIQGELTRSGVAPTRLHIEITETAAIRHLQDAQRFIFEMRKLGCKVCLDDFGAGFSSFTYLRHLPADIIKIDGIFIHNLAMETENQIFVRAMLDVARGFRKSVVAEGVEDSASLAVLQSYGIEMVQGYLLERPRPYVITTENNVIPFSPRSAA